MKSENTHKTTFVTQPQLPPLEDLIPLLEKIWANKILTNQGPLHEELENALCKYLNVPFISLVTNATIGLIVALEALKLKGEVITTPYSFVGTTHALAWKNLKPVFADIDPLTFNLDPDKIREAITPNTTAIMPVHCYGYPCNLLEIQKIATEFNLKVIYDAAHAFGVQNDSGSILNYGDLSVVSFHATKVFNTFEGGAIICQDENTKKLIDQVKNFGFVNEVSVVCHGINGKMSEFNAAIGLLQLKELDKAIAKRKYIDKSYRKSLKQIKGIICPINKEAIVANYSYFPILVTKDYPISRDALFQKLQNNNIYARRYFYPLISNFPIYSDIPSSSPKNLPNANQISNEIICLPIYPDLPEDTFNAIIQSILI